MGDVPFQWNSVGPCDGHLVQLHQKLLEGIKERPMGEQADGLAHVYRLLDVVLLPDVAVLQTQGPHLHVCQLGFVVFLIE